MNKEFDNINNKGLFDMTKNKLSLIRSLVDDAQRQTVSLGYIEHHGEIRVKVAEIKILIKEMETRNDAVSLTSEGDKQ